MNTKNKLIFGQAFLFLILIVSLGLIIVNEQAEEIFSPTIKRKMHEYIKENYANLTNNIEENNITYKNTKFKMKVSSLSNKNHYFYIIYDNGKITDTYNTDYIEGSSLLSNIKKSLEKEIFIKTNIKYKVIFLNKLNNYNSKVQEKIISEDNLLNLKFYYLSYEFEIKNWNYESITNQIINKINITESNNITPKYYEFTIINKNDITNSITISNIPATFVTDPYNKEIINTILNKGKLMNTEITYKYN